MLKKVFIITVLCSWSLYSLALDKLDKAIEEQNIEKVKDIVKIYQLNESDKNLALKIAKKIVKLNRERSQSLFKSGFDLTKVILGGIFAPNILVAAWTYYSYKKYDELLLNNESFQQTLLELKTTNEQAKSGLIQLSIMTFILGSLGTWVFIKGWTMSTAKGRLEKAEKIYRIIEQITIVDSKINPVI